MKRENEFCQNSTSSPAGVPWASRQFPANDRTESETVIQDVDLTQHIQEVRRARTARAYFFEGTLFGEPAWDILLILFACKLEQRRLSVSEVCGGSGVPTSTALRVLKSLEERGLVARRADPLDARRIFVSISDPATRAMREYYRAVRS